MVFQELIKIRQGAFNSFQEVVNIPGSGRISSGGGRISDITFHISHMGKNVKCEIGNYFISLSIRRNTSQYFSLVISDQWIW